MSLKLESQCEAVVEFRYIAADRSSRPASCRIDLTEIIEELVGVERYGRDISYFFRNAEIHGEIR